MKMAEKAGKEPYDKPTLEIFSIPDLVPDTVLVCQGTGEDPSCPSTSWSGLNSQDLDFRIPAA